MFGCYAISDKAFLRGVEIGRFWAKNGFSTELAWMQPYSHVEGIQFIKLNGEKNDARYFILQVF